MAITDARARNAKAQPKAYKLADEKGLFLLVHPNGSKYWRLKYRLAGKEKLLAVGVYPETTLAEARELTGEARKLVKEGRDPVAERQAVKARAAVSAATTFEGVAREWMESRAEQVGPVVCGDGRIHPQVKPVSAHRMSAGRIHHRAGAARCPAADRGARRPGGGRTGASLGGRGLPLRHSHGSG